MLLVAMLWQLTYESTLIQHWLAEGKTGWQRVASAGPSSVSPLSATPHNAAQLGAPPAPPRRDRPRKVVHVLVLLIAKYVEPQAPGLIALSAKRVHLDRVEKALPLLGLDPNLDPQR